MRRARAVGLIVVLVVLSFAGDAFAQEDYPPGGTQLVVRDLNGDNFFVPGEGGTASGIELTPDKAYMLEFEQDGRETIGEGRTDDQGNVLFTYRIPDDAKSGSASLLARPEDGEGDEVTAAIQVLTPEQLEGGRRLVQEESAASGWLPRSRLAIPVYVIIALLLVGLGWMLGTRSQRRAATAVQPPQPEPPRREPEPPPPPGETPPPRWPGQSEE